jgi:DNA-binding HxlR family transcriptional regulator
LPATTYAASSPSRATRPAELRRPPRSDLELIEHVDHALDALQGKWKVHLLVLMARGVHRHSRLLDCLPGASKKIMTDTLRALERDGLVARTVVPEAPVRVDYSLTALGWTMTEPLVALAAWGEAHGGEVADSRASYRRGSDQQRPAGARGG